MRYAYRYFAVGEKMTDILIAEDDINLNYLITKHLTDRGFNVISCFDGNQTYDSFRMRKADLLICDLLMPGTDGVTLVKKIKGQKSDFPIIVLTALDTYEDKKACFESGADDYIVKPVNVDELILRINALMRRYRLVSLMNIEHRGMKLDYTDKSLSLQGNIIELTKKEFLLIYMLLSAPGRIFSRNGILDEVWGYDSESIERTVDVHINKLREKLKDCPIEIITVRGLGYKAVLI